MEEPADLVFISPTSALISNSGGGDILKLDMKSGNTSQFAAVETPKGLFFDPISNQVVVASFDKRKLFFYNVSDGKFIGLGYVDE